MPLWRRVVSILLLCLGAAGFPLAPDTQAYSPAQNAADCLREAASADVAFLAAGLLKSDFKSGELTHLLQYPTDDLVVVSLTGAQIRKALERSVSLFPSPNPAFLQLSGIEASFSKSAAPEKRLVEVTVGTAKLQDDKTYKVAMPGSLSRGGLGYFKVWTKEQVARTIVGRTIESFLKGKTSSDTPPRWKELP